MTLESANGTSSSVDGSWFADKESTPTSTSGDAKRLGDSPASLNLLLSLTADRNNARATIILTRLVPPPLSLQLTAKTHDRPHGRLRG